MLKFAHLRLISPPRLRFRRRRRRHASSRVELAVLPRLGHGVPRRPRARQRYVLRGDLSRRRAHRHGTYETAHEVVRAYDAVAWRLGRPRSSMNFHDVWTCQQAEDLAPPPSIVRQEEQHRRRETEHRLRIAERDERAAREWAARFPEDVAAENEHFRRRRAEKATRRAAKKEDRARRRAEKATKRAFIEAQLAGPTTIDEDDPRWIDLFSSDPVSGTTPDSSDVEF